MTGRADIGDRVDDCEELDSVQQNVPDLSKQQPRRDSSDAQSAKRSASCATSQQRTECHREQQDLTNAHDQQQHKQRQRMGVPIAILECDPTPGDQPGPCQPNRQGDSDREARLSGIAAHYGISDDARRSTGFTNET